MSVPGEPLDNLLSFAGGDAGGRIPSSLRALSLEVMIGDPAEEHPAHLVVTLGVTPAAVELLQALAQTGQSTHLTDALEAALRDAAARAQEDLAARADTLARAQQAAGPSPSAVPPTDPPPAASSSLRPLTALPGGRTDPPPDADRVDEAAAAAARARRPATRAAPAGRIGPRPNVQRRRSVFAGPPLRERILAELADLPQGETLRSGELQRRCRASQPSTDKALRALVDEREIARVGKKGAYGYRIPTAAEKAATPASTSRPASAGPAASASSAPPPAIGRTPIGNGKTGKVSARRSGSDGATLGGRILGVLQLADLTPEGVCSRLGEPLHDVEQALEELRGEDDVQRLPDGRFRAVL